MRIDTLIQYRIRNKYTDTHTPHQLTQIHAKHRQTSKWKTKQTNTALNRTHHLTTLQTCRTGGLFADSRKEDPGSRLVRGLYVRVLLYGRGPRGQHEGGWVPGSHEGGPRWSLFYTASLFAITTHNLSSISYHGISILSNSSRFSSVLRLSFIWITRSEILRVICGMSEYQVRNQIELVVIVEVVSVVVIEFLTVTLCTVHPFCNEPCSFSSQHSLPTLKRISP